MTRDQALEIALGRGKEFPPCTVSSLLNILEALGLIKFDADERDEGRSFVQHMGPVWAKSPSPDKLGSAIIEDIEKMGLKIVRA